MRNPRERSFIYRFTRWIETSKTRLFTGLAVFILLITYLPLAFSPAEASGPLGLPLHSARAADYRAEFLGSRIPVVDIRIVQDVLRDLSPKDPNIDGRVDAVYAALLTPVPTATPRAGATQTISDPAATATATITGTAEPSRTPTQTASPSPTASATLTASATATATFRPTNTPVLYWPTAAHTAQPTRTPTASLTQSPTQMPTVTTQANRPPVISGPASQSAAAGSLYAFWPAASDPDGDSLVFSIHNKPAWAAFQTSDGALTGTPANAHAGSTWITITVSDGSLSASLTFLLTVTYTNHAPTISGPAAQTTAAGTAYTFTPTANDPDGDSLAYSVTGKPAWAAFDPATGTLSGTPENADAGTSLVTIRASDGSLWAEITFALTVTYTNHPPVLTAIADHAAAADQLYVLTPTASDPDGNLLAFSITNKPSWMSFDPSTGVLSGTPSNADVGIFAMALTVSDGHLSASQSFTLEVTYTNHPPMIAGSTVQFAAADDAYIFIPAASDPDGDLLAFSATGVPVWAAFDPATGTISGTPTNAHVGASVITITVTDGALSASLTITLTVTYTNHPPTIGGAAVQAVAAGDLYEFAPAASDPDGDALTFTITNQPAWAVFDSATGLLRGTPGNEDAGTHWITISVSDGALSAYLVIDLTVLYTNYPPQLDEIADQTVPADSPFALIPSASDANGDPLSFIIAGQPSWAYFDPATGRLHGTPTNASVGRYTITLTVSDGYLTDSRTFLLEVTYTNHAPEISGELRVSTAAGSFFTYSPTAWDADGDELTFMMSPALPWAAFHTATGTISGTPDNRHVGTTEITITVSDGALTAELRISLEVTYTNHAPTITGAVSQTIAADSLYAFTPTAEDADGDALIFSAADLPSWASFDPGDGSLTGTPRNSDVGTHSITITVSDGSLSAHFPFSLTVLYTNHAPVISGPASLTASADMPFTFTPASEDVDGDLLTFSVAGKPGWLSFDPADGSLNGTPNNSHVGTYDLTITVSDGALTSSYTVLLTVTYTNHAPMISGEAYQTAPADQHYAFTPAASDADGDALTFSITNMPAWAAFDPASGSLSGTPSNADLGASTVTITVTDGDLSASLQFVLQVTYTNHAPTIGGQAVQVAAADQVYRFVPTASDPDGDLLVFTIFGLPGWAMFDAADGALTGTPSNADVGAYAITITVSDGSLTADFSFTLTVTYTNHAPLIVSVGDHSAPAGVPYRLLPAASDPDGDVLTFLIEGKPGWASFDAATGELSGTPVNADAGETSITITVSDGAISAGITFTLTITYTNQPPTISGTAEQVTAAGAFYSFTPAAADPDGDALVFSITAKPGWASFDSESGSLSGTPSKEDAGVYGFTITVSDGTLAAHLPITLTVTYTNRRPTISGEPDQTALAGRAYSVTPAASDPDGDSLFFEVFNLPAWAEFDSSDGTLFGTPANVHAGTYTITIRVSDGALTADFTFNLTVLPNNHAPTISGPASQTVNVNTYFSLTPTAADPDGDALTFSVLNKPPWAAFNTATGTLSGTPSVTHSGTTSITIRVSDGRLAADYTFTLTVSFVVNPPICAAVQPGRFMTTASGDSYLEHKNPTKMPGGENRLKVRVDSTNDTKYAVIQFDLSAIAANTVINKAYLYLTFRSRTAGQTTTVYRLTTGWDEATVSWNNARTGTPWNTPGGDFAPGGYAAFATDTQCVMRLDITRLVQGWIDGDYPNYGIILVSAGPDGEVTFTAKDDGSAGERPALVIDY